MNGRWDLTVRAGPQVEHHRYATLDEALSALEEQASALEPQAARDEVKFFNRRIAPVAQVAARLEIAGPGSLFRPTVHGGVDLRGDGSEEAYTGRVRRTVVEQRPGESAPAALRRALTSGS